MFDDVLGTARDDDGPTATRRRLASLDVEAKVVPASEAGLELCMEAARGMPPRPSFIGNLFWIKGDTGNPSEPH
jgi:hypothetical protein